MINFSELYDRTVDNLFALGMTYTFDREMIKDCIQDVFVKLYAKRHELGAVANIESYLYVSLRNRINDEFRHNSHLCDKKIDDNSMNAFGDDDVYDLEFVEEERKRTRTVSDFLKHLSPRQQQIINLYYIERLKYNDICQIMGINYQSVRNLMHRSLSRLRILATNSEII
ncbi:MAG: sigma-70 family RNA polymerase sigma factor [Prevotella sp.]|nr:sigma-70 family RNA polymerase sigma factor [Prevotella sp.]